MIMSETLEKASQALKHYCAYQERCHSEVRKKLYSLDLGKNEVEAVLTNLIEEGYLNEERFAVAYARGKFRMNQWGKVKILVALKQRKISAYCTRKALASIDDTDYKKTFTILANKRLQSLRAEKNIFIRKRKLRDHLLQKGYETTMINEWLKTI